MHSENEQFFVRVGSANSISETVTSSFVGRQQTTDATWTGFPFYQKMMKLPDKSPYALSPEMKRIFRRQDWGSNFSTAKYDFENRSGVVTTPKSGFYRYVGKFYADLLHADSKDSAYQQSCWRVDPVEEDSELFAYGGTAISRCAPVNPSANVFQMLGELKRDGLPSIPGLTTVKGRNPQALAGDYLNYQFGVVPLASDIKKLIKSLKTADTILRQYLRDSGKVVRRSYTFPDEIETEDTLLRNDLPIPRISAGGFYSKASFPLHRITEFKRKTWFSGAFTYHVSEQSLAGFADEIQKAQRLYGVLPTPGAVYDLTPWSWFVDWFINLGDVLNNISMMITDGLVMPYGYIMRHTQKSVTFCHYGAQLGNGPFITDDQVYKTDLKFRRKASPFGFGLTANDFTVKQWAILTALGITQGGRGVAK